MDMGRKVETAALVPARRPFECSASAPDRRALAPPRSDHRLEMDRLPHPADDAHTRHVSEARELSADVLHAWEHSLAAGDAADTNRLVSLAHAIRAAESRRGVGIIG